MKKRLLSLLMALCLMLTLVPAAFAADATVTTEAELTSALTNATAGDKITLGADITLTNPLTIEKAVTIDGTSAKYAISYTGSATEYTITTTVPNVVLKNLTINRNSGENGVFAQSSGLQIIDCDINAYFHGVRFYISGNNDNATLDISGSKIVNTKAATNGVYYNTSNGGVITKNITNGLITISDCQILGYKYSLESYIDPVNGFCDGKDTMFDVSDTVIRGWAALNIWSANTDFYFTDCTLIGINTLSGSSNSYSVIVANHGIYGNVANSGSSVNIAGGSLIAVKKGECDQSVFSIDNEYQTEIAFEKGTDNNPVSIECYSVDNVPGNPYYIATVWDFYYLDWMIDPVAAQAKADNYMLNRVTGYDENVVIHGRPIGEYASASASFAECDLKVQPIYAPIHTGGGNR